ncbi:MAG: acyl-CoA dehydrogenase family protein [Candidatus Zixiibacteriota bacterium]
MPYNIDPKQQAVRDEVKVFADREIYPVSEELDHMAEPRKFPVDLYRKIGQAGFIGYAMPEEFGGGAKSQLEYITLIEELCYHDPAVGLLCAVGELATFPILHFGNQQQKEKYVPDCASGKHIPAFVLTESEAGSSAANQKTEAVLNENHYVVNGEKIFVRLGDVADLAVLFCKVKDQPNLSALIVDDTTQVGWDKRTLKHTIGMRAVTMSDIRLRDVKIPKENLLGEIGKGYDYAMAALDSARVRVAAQKIGLAQRALDEAVSYAKKRHAFGAPIAKLQAIQWMIADMSTRLEAARCLTYSAAVTQDKGEPFALQALQAKLYATATASFCIDRAMQIHGGYGYIGEFTPIEKLYRDQCVMGIHEDSSEVQRLAIARKVIEEK